MKKNLFLLIGLMFMIVSCNDDAISTSGAKKTTTEIQTDLNGQTAEQINVIKRMKQDNTPGSIKHLYIISAYSGQVLLYSTVRAKVTSSGKKLSPTTAKTANGEFKFELSKDNYAYTSELLGDDGTYGSSAEYIYWFDSKDIYHQQYITGGMIVHVSSEPIAVKSVIMNLEVNNLNDNSNSKK